MKRIEILIFIFMRKLYRKINKVIFNMFLLIAQEENSFKKISTIIFIISEKQLQNEIFILHYE